MSSTSWPMVEQAQQVLLEHGHEHLAAELTRLVVSEQQARHAADVNFQAWRELQAKYEPRLKGPSYINWTGD